MDKHGVAEIKKVMAMGIELMNIAPVLKSEKNAMSKILAFGDLADELMALANLDVDQMKREVLELSEAEKAELMDFVAEKHDIADDEKEAMAEAVMQMGIRLMDVVADSFAMAQKYSK